MKTLYSAALFFFIACAGLKSLCAEVSSRDRLLMDFGWRFYLGDDWGIAQNLGKAGTGFGPASVTFSDASWRNVDLPHDWAIELPFDQKADGSHGFRALGAGFLQNSVGWYRRRFDVLRRVEVRLTDAERNHRNPLRLERRRLRRHR